MPTLVRLARDILREVESGRRKEAPLVFEPSGGPETVPVDTKLTKPHPVEPRGQCRALFAGRHDGDR